MMFIELVEQVAAEQRLTKRQAMQLVRALLVAIKRAVAKDGRLALPGFGVFSIGSRKARLVLNPQTKEPMRLPAVRRPKFHASRNWKIR